MTDKRKRRLASDEALSWVRNSDVDDVHARLLLMMLALYVNSEGECWVGLRALAEDCKFDRKTVVRRLNWLQARGYITRKRQWISVGGARNSEGRGKPSSDLIKLMIEDVEYSSATDDIQDDASQWGTIEGPLEESSSGPSSGALVGPQRGSSVGHMEGSVYEPEPEPEKTRVRARAGKAARSRAVKSNELVFVREGTRWWDAILPYFARRGEPRPKPYHHENQTGHHFPRNLIDIALHEARAPPVADDAESANDCTSSHEGDNVGSRQFTASLSSISLAGR